MRNTMILVFVVAGLCAAAALGQRGGRGGPGERVAVPDTIRIEKDIDYVGAQNPRQTLDLLLPKVSKAPGRPLPVIVAVHGGAFKMGNKGMGLRDIVDLVASGDYAGVTINYRLSGEAIWPAQIHDCKAAVRWVRANAGKYNLDPERIGVIGGSAGGHLVAMLGLTGENKDLEGDLGPHKGLSSKVQCVVDMFGPVDLLTLNHQGSRQDHDAANSPEGQLIGGAIPDNKDKAKAASPITYVSPKAPPFLILHGDADPLIPIQQSQQLYDALKKAGVESLFVKVLGAGHGGFRNPEVAKRIRQFFDRHLRGQAERISEVPIPNAGGGK